MGKTLQESKDEFNEEVIRLKKNFRDNNIKILCLFVLIEIVICALYFILT